MHSDGRNGGDTIGRGNSLNGGGNFGVLGTSGNGSSSDQHGIVGSDGNISQFLVFLRRSDGVSGFFDDNSVGSNGDVSVNVASQIHFDNIAGL
jgi:hypothetical protein